MVTPITRAELSELAERLDEGDLCDWCKSSSAGEQSVTVYADSGMLSRCREAVNLPDTQLEDPSADVQG